MIFIFETSKWIKKSSKIGEVQKSRTFLLININPVLEIQNLETWRLTESIVTRSLMHSYSLIYHNTSIVCMPIDLLPFNHLLFHYDIHSRLLWKRQNWSILVQRSLKSLAFIINRTTSLNTTASHWLTFFLVNNECLINIDLQCILWETKHHVLLIIVQ